MLITPEKRKYNIYFGKENIKKKGVNFATTCMNSSSPLQAYNAGENPNYLRC